MNFQISDMKSKNIGMIFLIYHDRLIESYKKLNRRYMKKDLLS